MKRDLEVLCMLRERAKGRTQEQAAARAGMSVRTAGTYERRGQLPSQLQAAPHLPHAPEPVRRRLAVGRRASSNATRRCRPRRCSPCWATQHPGRYQAGASCAPCSARSPPGAPSTARARRSSSPRSTGRAWTRSPTSPTWPSLGVTLGGVPFPHLVFHLVLSYSNVEAIRLCFSESFESLVEGIERCLWQLGGVPQRHRTDHLSAAIRPLDADGQAQAQGALRRADAPLRAGADDQQRWAWRTRTATSSRRTTASRRRSTRRCACGAAATFATGRPTRGSCRRSSRQRNLTRQARWAEEQAALRPAAGDAAGAVPRGAGAGQPLQHHPGAAQHLLGAVAADRHHACWCACGPRRWRSTGARPSC